MHVLAALKGTFRSDLNIVTHSMLVRSRTSELFYSLISVDLCGNVNLCFRNDQLTVDLFILMQTIFVSVCKNKNTKNKYTWYLPQKSTHLQYHGVRRYDLLPAILKLIYT